MTAPARRSAKGGAQSGPRAEDHGELLRKAALGDAGSQERLVAAYLPAITRLAQARDGEGLSVTDLVQEGSIGLLEAVLTFSGSGEREFAAFAEVLISAQLTSAIETEAASVRDARLLVTAAEDYDRTEILLRRTLHRAPAEAEIAEKLEWTVERTRYVAEAVAEARRRYDEQLLAFVDPGDIDFDGVELADGDDEPIE
jgi:RNA polymerase sigma factor (sigma-70 family)